MSDSDETTPFEFNLDSDAETETIARKRRSYCKGRHSAWALLCGAVMIVALLALVGLAVRISNTQESAGNLHDAQEGSGELPSCTRGDGKELTSCTQGGSSAEQLPSDPLERALALMRDFPLVDGHNDLPIAIRGYYMNQLDKVDLSKNGSGTEPTWQTDIPRLRAGKVGGQFWAAFMSCSTQYKDATRTFIDQMDVVKLFVQKYPDTFQFATTAADLEHAVAKGKIASLIGVEGGHAIDSSLGTLRQLYDLGARYMTLTHTCNTPWAHSSVDSSPNGLTDFGRRVVREMNRIGMLVDISHVNNYTMMDVLDTSLAPVIFSHSSAYALCNNPRNVPDNVLRRLPENGGVVMVNFYPGFINCSSEASLSQVADHIEYIKVEAGIDHVGIGSDFDGIDRVPVGLEDVSKYPALFAVLIERGFSDNDVKKIARHNIVRVFKAVEKVRDELRDQSPDNTLIDPQPSSACRPDF